MRHDANCKEQKGYSGPATFLGWQIVPNTELRPPLLQEDPKPEFKAIIIHHSGDIDAAGDEVEQAVRVVLSRKLLTAALLVLLA
jgi:hypothetical protein